jgi:hypothetical protein
MAGLVSSGTTRGEPLFVPGSASFASGLAGQVTAIGWLGSKSTWAPEPREGSVTFELISQRGKGYLKTAQTLLRAAQTMADRAIADRLKALAEDYQRQTEKVSYVGATKAFARPADREGERRT